MKAFYLGKDFKGDPPLYMKVAAGLTTGALAIAVASPTDLVKVQPDLLPGKRLDPISGWRPLHSAP